MIPIIVRYSYIIDAQTSKLTDIRDMPWCVTALLVSQPLHFVSGRCPMRSPSSRA
jgi:hypothetical protein